MGGRSSGGARGGMLPGDAHFRGTISDVEPLKNIKDPQVYKAVKEAISRYHAVLGVQQKNVKLATLPDGVGGAHITRNGQSDAVYLNKKLFKGSKAAVEGYAKSAYKDGWLTSTNKPVAHIPTHELAHATWNQHMTGAKHVAAGKSISKVYNAWKADTKKSGYGKYAATNVSEFFSEVTTKAVHGKSDKYTKAIKGIIKKHNL